MTLPPQGVFLAAGIADYDTVNFTFSAHGVVPSVIVVQTYAEAIGNLSSRPFSVTFTYDTITRQFQDCKLDSQHVTFSENGNRVTLRIFDHRWRWEFAPELFTIHANRRIGKKIIEDTKRSAREIAVELLKAAGEKRHDVDAVPKNHYPEILITGEKPPMTTLQELISQYGLRVCYVPQTGLVKIVRPGEGATLPINDWLAYPAHTFDPPELPDRVRVLGDNVEFQCKFELEAVAEDKDGKLHKLDDAPYKPDDGWNNVYPESVGDSIEDDEERTAAIKSVFKFYRIRRSTDSKDDKSLIKWLEQLKDRKGEPITVTKVEQINVYPRLSDVEELPDGTERPKKAKLTGEWYDWKPETRKNKQNIDEGEYPGGWSLDAERYLVVLSEPAILFDEDDKDKGPVKPAKLELECVFHLRTAPEEALLRPFYEKRIANSGAGTKVYVRNELKRVVKFIDGEIEDGEDEFNEAAQAEIELILASLTTERGAVGIYNRIEPVDPDGAIQQIAYVCGGNGATTVISRNHERSLVSASYAQRRKIARENAELDTPPKASQDGTGSGL